MKVFLIAPPKDEEDISLFTLNDYSSKARSNQHPLGLLYLYSYLKPFHEVKIFDMNALELPISAIKDELEIFKPDLVGITQVIGKVVTVRKLAQEIKKYSSAKICLGGQNASLYPWENLQYPYFDFVISGFGQVPLKELCDALENNLDTDNINRVYTKNNCKKKIQGTFEFVNVDDFPIPDRGILPIENYQMPFAPENPCTSMITSLGCPFHCGFCASRNYKPVTLRSPENIVAEMKHIESLGIRSIMFQDELFTMNVNRIKSICSLIIKENVKLHWSVRSRANLVNMEALTLMKDAGAFNVHLGIESGTNRILGEMNKKLDIDLIEMSVNAIKNAGLKCTGSFMIGYPDETKTEILATIQFAKKLQLDVSQFYYTAPEPNTPLYCQVKTAKGLSDDIYSDFTLDPDSVDLKNNIASNLFSKEELEGFLKLAYSQTKNLYNLKENRS